MPPRRGKGERTLGGAMKKRQAPKEPEEDEIKTEDTREETPTRGQASPRTSPTTTPKTSPAPSPQSSPPPAKKARVTKRVSEVHTMSSDESEVTRSPQGPSNIPQTQASAEPSEGSEVEEVVGGSQKRKKRKVQITDEQAQKLIEFLKANPALWDRDDENFRKEKDKNVIWEAGLQAMSGFKSIEDMKKAWANIRDTYTKMHNTSKASGSGVFVPKGSRRRLIWSHANFLHSNVSHNKPSQTSSLPYQKRQAQSTISLAPLSDDSQGFGDIPLSQGPPPPPQPRSTVARPSSAASAGGASSRSGAGPSGGGGLIFRTTNITQATYEALLKDRDEQRESLNRILEHLPRPCSNDPKINSFCHFLSSILETVPENLRQGVQFNMISYAHSFSTMCVNQSVQSHINKQGPMTSHPLPPSSQQQQQQQHQPPVVQLQQQHQQPPLQQYPPLQQQQPPQRPSSVPTTMSQDYFSAPSPDQMFPPPPVKLELIN